MINVPQAHRELLAALDPEPAAIALLERLKTLEMLRESIAYLQDANAKKYLGKASLALAELAAAGQRTDVAWCWWWPTSMCWMPRWFIDQLQSGTSGVGQSSLPAQSRPGDPRACAGVSQRCGGILARNPCLPLASESGWCCAGSRIARIPHSQASSCTAVYAGMLLLDSIKLSGNSAPLAVARQPV